MWIGASALYAKIGQGVAVNYQTMGLNDPTAAKRSYVLVSTSEAFTGHYAPAQFAAETGVRIASWRLLSLCECDHTLTRTGERAFDVALDGSLLSSPFAALLRSPKYAPAIGERVQLTDMVLQILGVDEQGQPDRFSVELSSQTLPEFWAWSDGAMTQFDLPELGQSRTFKWVHP
jgi:hypothetical protein